MGVCVAGGKNRETQEKSEIGEGMRPDDQKGGVEGCWWGPVSGLLTSWGSVWSACLCEWLRVGGTFAVSLDRDRDADHDQGFSKPLGSPIRMRAASRLCPGWYVGVPFLR